MSDGRCRKNFPRAFITCLPSCLSIILSPPPPPRLHPGKQISTIVVIILFFINENINLIHRRTQQTTENFRSHPSVRLSAPFPLLVAYSMSHIPCDCLLIFQFQERPPNRFVLCRTEQWLYFVHYIICHCECLSILGPVVLLFSVAVLNQSK